MAKSKKVDESGLSNDTRSIYLERTGPDYSEYYGHDDEIEFTYGDPKEFWDDTPEDVKLRGKERLTQPIEIPEHLRRMFNA